MGAAVGVRGRALRKSVGPVVEQSAYLGSAIARAVSGRAEVPAGSAGRLDVRRLCTGVLTSLARNEVPVATSSPPWRPSARNLTMVNNTPVTIRGVATTAPVESDYRRNPALI